MSAARATAAHLLTKLAVLLAVAAAVILSLYAILNRVRASFDCEANLKAIYGALELYEQERGSLPRLAYFPDDPMEDEDSLRVVLEPYGAVGRICVCPAAPRVQASLGLTYVWNVRLNGRKMPRDEKEWVLVEMNALSTDVPAPHLGRYNVLYSDGSVERIKTPLKELPGL